jgi:hypothetical protein
MRGQGSDTVGLRAINHESGQRFVQNVGNEIAFERPLPILSSIEPDWSMTKRKQVGWSRLISPV